MMANHSLKKRIIIGFMSFALLIAMVFSLFNFMFLYNVEDTFFDAMIKEEAQYIQAHWLNTGKLVQPKRKFMTAYNAPNALPVDLQRAMEQAPNQREYSGDESRHYHVLYSTKPDYVLVAEVSDYLVVRPLRLNIALVLVATSLIMILFALILGYWIAKRTTKPLSQLATLVADTSPTQLPTNFSKDFPNNEIGLLASTLENSLLRINQFIEREQNFTRDASHELRTPVTIIKNAMELLDQQDCSEKEKLILARVTQANRKMEQTINTLLSLAREEKQPKKFNYIKILPLIERAIIEQATLLEGKNVEVDVSVKMDREVQLSSVVLQILLTNLIANAFQYTEQGIVSISMNGNTLCISDSGKGIDKNIQGNVFDPLVKGENSKGFGIGLSLVKRLCEQYQLTLEIDSSDNGLSVSISFPLATKS